MQSVTQPPNGTAVVNGDNTITYTPDPNYSGTDTFTYTISDGNGGTATATVTVNVGGTNDDPVATDDTRNTLEDTPVTIPVLGNDSDPDGDTLAVQSVTQPANGTVVINGNGTVTYTPNANYSGTDTFTYTVSDGNGGTATATVTVTVAPINDPPVAIDDLYGTLEDTPLNVPAPGVLGNDSDVDGDVLTVFSFTQPANGTVTLTNNGSFDYVPDTHFSGTDTFTYVVSDGKGGGDTATVTIDVTAVNDDPDAVDDNGTTVENIAIIIAVLGNDTDPENNPLTVQSVTQPANGTTTINPDNTITYTPNAGFTGIDTFTYTITDGNGGTDTATVTVTVTPVIPPGGSNNPVATGDIASTDEDAAVVVAVLGNDSDPNGDPLTVTAVSDPPNGTATINGDGTITYTPDKDFNGTDTFTYTVTDGNGGTATATVTVTVTPINDAPVAIQDTASTTPGTPVVIAVLTNDTDADGDPLTVTSTTTPTGGTVTINGDGTITYTPNPGFTGIDTFTYTISDGNGSTTTATVTVAVGVTNGPPVFANDPANTSQTIEIGTKLQPLTASDPDGDTYTFTVTAGTLPPGVTLNADGTFTGTPTATGTFTATITICDSNGLCSNGVLSIQVVPPGQLPHTGVDSDTLALIGILMTLLGGILVTASRRRSQQDT